MEETAFQSDSTPKLPERNPDTHAAHRRSFFWQVTLPFIVLLLVFFGLIAGVSWGAVNGSSELRRWADVALIWQLPLPIFLSLLCLVVHAALLFGLIRLIGVVPGGARKLHNYVLLVQTKVNEISDRLVAPIIQARKNQAKVDAVQRAVLRALKRNK